jgi:hypothetical protein
MTDPSLFRYNVFLRGRYLIVRALRKEPFRMGSDYGGQLSSDTVTQPAIASSGQVDQPEPAARQNSAVVYGLGFFGLSTTTQALAGLYLFFYVDVLGLAVALAAVINIIYAIWDAVNDPLVGYLSDNTRSRWGRRRPWLLAGLPFYLLLFVLIYAVPGVFRQGDALFWYALVVIFLFEAASTVMNTNYQALFPDWYRAGISSPAG